MLYYLLANLECLTLIPYLDFVPLDFKFVIGNSVMDPKYLFWIQILISEFTIMDLDPGSKNNHRFTATSFADLDPGIRIFFAGDLVKLLVKLISKNILFSK
jgi:hypothetical protein